jgi:hypothetical protein
VNREMNLRGLKMQGIPGLALEHVASDGVTYSFSKLVRKINVN